MKLLLLLAVAVSIAFIGYKLLQRCVTYIIPDKFTGLITLVETPDTGVPLPVGLRGIVITIPNAGKVEVKSIDVLRNWDLVRARFASGQSINVVPYSGGDSEDLSCWMLPVPAGERLYLFVGKHSEARSFIDSHYKEMYRAPPVDLR